MIDALAFAITVGCAGGALGVVVLLAGRRYRWRRIVPTLVALQVSLLVQAVLDVIGLLTGHRPAEPVTHIAYLLASLVVLPAAAAQANRDDGGWAAVLLAVALVALAVIVVRMTSTWRPDVG